MSHTWSGLFVALLLPVVAQAATVVEQTLPDAWLASPTGYCSPCTLQPGARMFASFTLDDAAEVNAARFAAISTPFGVLGDFSVSIWSSPLAPDGPLVETFITESQYTPFTGSSGYIDVNLPTWNLGPGSYWLSLFGAGGDAFQWGGIINAGDDRRYVNGIPTLIPTTTDPRNYLLGFSLRSSEPVVAPIGGTLPLLLGGLGLLACVRRTRAA